MMISDRFGCPGWDVLLLSTPVEIIKPCKRRYGLHNTQNKHKMKKLMIAALCLVLLSSCQKELGCGTVVGGYIECDTMIPQCRWYVLRVKFGDNIKRVYVDEKTYRSYYTGSSICF